MAKSFLDGYKTYDTRDGYGNAKQWKKAFNQRMSKEEAESILSRQQETPYNILQISPGATQAEIKKAYRQLIKEWHPDKNQHRSEEAEEMSKKIIAAFSMLSH
ncbi:DnaJ domain-containing protein [Chitinophaga terrae (ex Kim and Jung 2007)]|uniref:DnaJ domain-containing protein n=1 Tax=Chitinophaga terrae (ex Kim and Jung 2007) TaxID=408074 RepID=A0A1H4BN46_9BACT|nr:J domain-containing protein [Chitinophaga terrae (ex Kim and Jung 2007)]MDQ0110266.1 DnaJ-class molecular chaperone [Chitinophaga terrae (ex Kim and Jung 2007)]GEP89672.1 hypothetical protein CTE07_13170 [Chitinophaga terrae (ex Kim and Jung 2007)]SEA49549.1 DnaJ domain-containing protein [Chitinophaga terrae (ex Kim and Jung 2007)]